MTLMSGVRRIKELARRLKIEEEGQALVEYALLVSLVALVAFGSVNFFGIGVHSLYSKVVASYP
jgi:Flp pilus assembly pilin Flp